MLTTIKWQQYLRVALLLACTACQSVPAPTPEESNPQPHKTWPEILTLLQDGRFNLQTLTDAEARELGQHLEPLVTDRAQWSRLSYIIARLHRSPADAAHLLGLSLDAQLAFESKNYAAVEKACLEILALRPDDAPAKLALGLIYLYGGQFAKAIPYLNDAKPNPKALAGLISAHRLQGDNDVVDALCAKYQSERSDLWEISYNCSLFEAQNMQSPDKALRILAASLAQQTADSEASRQLRQAITRIEVARLQKPGQETTL